MKLFSIIKCRRIKYNYTKSLNSVNYSGSTANSDGTIILKDNTPECIITFKRKTVRSIAQLLK